MFDGVIEKVISKLVMQLLVVSIMLTIKNVQSGFVLKDLKLLKNQPLKLKLTL